MVAPSRDAPGSGTSSSSSSSSSLEMPERKDGKSAKEAKSTEEDRGDGEPGDPMVSLLVAADRFQVAELVALCVEHLASDLGVDNLAERFVVADQCGLGQLAASCLGFVRADPTRLAGVMDSDGWARLRPEQVEQMFADFVIPSGTPRKGGRKRARPADLATDPDLQPPVSATRTKTSTGTST